MPGGRPLVAGGSPSLGSAARRRNARGRLSISAQSDKAERWRPQGARGSGKAGGSGSGDGGEGSSSGSAAAFRAAGNAAGAKKQGGGGGNRRATTYVSDSGMTLKQYVASDGREHLGSAIAQQHRRTRPFPGPPPDSLDAPPLRILPVGGLGEIGMNCMMAGVRDRYVVIDAGLMFPDFSDLGMQKILPDTAFLAQWRDKIEALIITHGHEDHIGALPWVIPALDPSTPIFATSFVMQLVKRRMTEYNLWDERRFKVMNMRERFRAGPFEIEPVRVTHSIPDCCGLIMRSSEGTLVHTGDWKIDETPMDGQNFDRELFQALGTEPVALMMSDSTNVLSPGRTLSEQVVHDSIVDKVLQHNGKGRIILTQFASNLHRLYGVKQAADASGRKVAFVGASLSHYLEAAWQDGRAPFDPKELLAPEQLRHTDPNEVLIVTTGSQGEPRAQLSMAARDESHVLKILPDDLLLYSAKVIPGNEGKVTKMLNALAEKGARVRQSRADNLHTSGHAYQEELVELLQSVRPQHFLPVHGEYAFLTEHALLARERAGVNFVEVIRNGEMLAVRERRNRNTVSTGSMAAATTAAARRAFLERHADPADGYTGPPSLVKFDGEEPTYFFNDGGKGTGTRGEMEVDVRTKMAVEGVVVLAVDVLRGGSGEYGLGCNVRVTTRGIWTDEGRLLGEVKKGVESMVCRLDGGSSLVEVERTAIDAARRRCLAFNGKKPEIIAVAYEHDPRDSHLAAVAEARAAAAREASTARPKPERLHPDLTPGPSRDDALSKSFGSRPRPTAASAAHAAPPPPPGAPSKSSSSGSSSSKAGVLSPVGAARRTRLPVPAAPTPKEEEPTPAAAPAAAPAARKASARRTAAGAVSPTGSQEEDTDLVAIGDSTDEEEPRPTEPGSAESGPTEPETTLGRMLKVRKASGVRKARSAAAAGGGAGAAGPPPLQPLDPRVIQERRRRNPRDSPSQAGSPDLGYD